MAFTTWDTVQKSSVTLTGSNLIATASGVGGVRAADTQISGKFYFEVTIGTIANGNTGIGICNSVVALDTVATTPNNATIVYKSGNIWVNGANTATNIGAIAATNVVCVAVDLTAKLIWYRVGAAGNWNGSSSNNPATGVGGKDISSIIPTRPYQVDLYPCAAFGASADAMTANFGATAFTGTVPSGFTSGWTTGTTAVTSLVTTQVGSEAWVTQASSGGDPSFNNVVLLCHFDGTNGSTTFPDSSNSHHDLASSAGAALTTTSPQFGSACLDTSPSSANVTLIDALKSDFNFGSGQFTVEGWVYYTSTPGTSNLVAQWGVALLGWFLGTDAGKAIFYYSTTGSDTPSVGGTWSPSLNTWYHLAADRDASNVLRVYVDGSVIASSTVSATFFASSTSVTIGNTALAFRTVGHIDDVRVTKGLARYGGTFTRPSAPFPDTLPVNPAPFRATQVGAEAWVTSAPPIRTTQLGREVWVTLTAAPIHVTQVGRAVWIDASRTLLYPTGVASSEAMGTPFVHPSGLIIVGGIPSEEIVGSPIIATGLNVTGITSSEALGTPHIIGTSAATTFFRGFP